MKLKEALAKYNSLSTPFTYQDYLEIPDDGQRYEVINGELDRIATPFLMHQRIAREVHWVLAIFLESQPVGEFFYAPVDVVFDVYNVVQPDLVFVANENASILTEKNISGAPDMIIEIISPGSEHQDRVRKKTLYEKFGVREYWLVHPEKQRIEIFIHRDAKYWLVAQAEKTGLIRSEILPGLELQLKNFSKNGIINDVVEKVSFF